MDLRPLHIQLLGGFLLVEDDAPITTLHAPRLQALLSLLVLKRDAPQSRQHLAFSLWPNSSEAQAQTNLRNLVHQLRRLLPRADAYLVLNGRTVQWRNDAPFTVDVASFEQALSQAEHALRRGDEVSAQISLETAITWYRGELLPGCYDEWILPDRERLGQRFTAALGRLIPLLEAQRDYPAAIQYTQRLLQIEPLHEAAYLQLTRLYALSGDRAAALRTYQVCAAQLRQELATEPGQPLRELYAQLLAKSPMPVLRDARQKLIGRREEWGRLLDCWQAAASGQPQLVVLSGEAGIGKTHLAEELLRWAEQQGFSTASAHCYPGEGEMIYAPVIAWLRAQPMRSRRTTLTPVWLAEIARLLPELRDECPGLPPVGPLNEPWQRQRLFEALRRAVLAAAPPLLLFVDDLQWCDRASLEWLRYLLHHDAPNRLLVVSSVRQEEVDADDLLADLIADLRARGHSTMVDLGPLDAADTVALATQVAGHALSVEQGATVYRETEGNPLFIVETIHAGCECHHAHACGGVDETSLYEVALMPSRVQAVIARRLARLSPRAYAIAGVAAVIGRSFTVPVLAQLCLNLDEDALVRGLDELWRRRIIRERPDGSYDFSHAKLREVAYQELSVARRRQQHRKVAEALEALPDDPPGAMDAQMAAHYAQAGCQGLAIHAYRRAAEAAQRIFAPAAAVAACRHALVLLDTVAPHQLELHQARALSAELEERLGDGLARLEQHGEARAAYARGLEYIAPDNVLTRARVQRLIGNSWRDQAAFDHAEQAYCSAVVILEQRGPDGEESSYWRAWLDIHLDRIETALWLGPFPAAISIQQAKMHEVLKQFGTPAQHARSLRCALSETCWRQRSQVDATLVAQAEQTLEWTEATNDPTLVAQARWLTGTIRLMHGDLEPAEADLRAALDLAERTDNLRIQAVCLATLSLLTRLSRQIDCCRQYAERTLELAGRYQFDDCLGMAHADLAWVAWRMGERILVETHGRQALDAWQRSAIVYPFQWTARMPLLAVALAGHDMAAAVAQAQALLHPLQQQLPAELETALTSAVVAATQGPPADASGHLWRALELAQHLGRL